VNWRRSSPPSRSGWASRPARSTTTTRSARHRAAASGPERDARPWLKFALAALYAAAAGELRRTTYQQDENLSRDQAIRDIQALTRAGLLTPHGHATGRVYVAAGTAADVAEAAAAAVRGPGRDPYS
jgi:hypothetical protein